MLGVSEFVLRKNVTPLQAIEEDENPTANAVWRKMRNASFASCALKAFSSIRPLSAIAEWHAVASNQKYSYQIELSSTASISISLSHQAFRALNSTA